MAPGRRHTILRFVQDLHVHTIFSDGELMPVDVVRRAAAAGVRTLGIADHESLGAFMFDEGAIWRIAGRFGVSLVASIEIDAEYEGHEIHILGHGLTIASSSMLAHCARVQRLRHSRTLEELEQVNQVLGRRALDPDQVFAPPRQTFMRPNLIMPLLDQGVFPSYEAGAAWFREHIKPATHVGRVSIPQALALVHQADGKAALAHPGYGIAEGWLDLNRDLPQLAAMGLDRIEANYPYAICSPHLFSPTEEDDLVLRVSEAAQAAGLATIAGSDSHRLSDFEQRWSLQRPTTGK